MIKPYRNIRTCKTKSRKFAGKCESCGTSLCSCRAYQYTDESNGACTNSSPYQCKSCYELVHGVLIKTDVDVFRDRLKDKLMEYSSRGVDFSEMDKLIKLIDAM